MKEITFSKLQEFIKEKDFKPELKKDYFLKLSEEVGELAKAMRKDLTAEKLGEFKGSIEEELYDVVYYTLALANIYDCKFEEIILTKEKLNDEKYGRSSIDKLLN